PHPKGVHTIDPSFLPLKVEAVTEGRQRTRRNLVRAINSFLRHMPISPNPEALQAELLDAIQDNDDYGLVYWYFRRDGATEDPFRTLRNAYRDVWDRIGRSL